MPFNPEHFRRRYPNRALPDLRFRPEQARWETGRRLAGRFGLALDGSDASPVWELFDRAVTLETPGPGSEQFYLTLLLGTYEIAAPATLYLDWYSGEQVEVAFRELLGFFNGFWEPTADDLAVFDDSCDWVLYFTRSGEVRLARSRSDEAT